LVSGDHEHHLPRVEPINMISPVDRAVQRAMSRRRGTPIAC
jgi:hypothetical protein